MEWGNPIINVGMFTIFPISLPYTISYLSHCCDQIPGKKQLGAEEAISNYTLRRLGVSAVGKCAAGA